jgi:lipid-A-disaccharide synthase
MAEFAKKKNIKVFYYISPKIWAWKENRVKKIKANVDELFTILPFETQFYQKHNIEVDYVGNPLLDSIEEFRKNVQSKADFLNRNDLDNRPVVALLAGSRIQEIKNVLPVMVKASRGNPDHQFIVAGVESVPKNLYKKLLKDTNIKVIFNQTYALLNHSYAALVTSGTAALETALFKVPQTVMYRIEGGWLIDVLMRHIFLKVKWVSLPNLILNKEVIKEYIQVDMTVKKIEKELFKLLYSENYRKKFFDEYDRLDQIIGEPGSSKRAAKKMVSLLLNS